MRTAYLRAKISRLYEESHLFSYKSKERNRIDLQLRELHREVEAMEKEPAN
jgi:hypothetical protein